MATKFPFIRQRPTVLDELPLDVIRVFIIPCLDYESRINFNQCLPPWDRISKKMKPMAIVAHERKVRVNTLKKIQYSLLNIEYPFSPDKENKRIKTLAKYFDLHLNPLYFSILKDNQGYRNMSLSKIREFTEELTVYREGCCINDHLKLIEVMTKLKKKIENSGPYGPCLRYSTDIHTLDFS